MDGLKKNILPLLILILLVSLAIGFRSFLMANIIEPVAYLCWAIWRAVASLNQNIYWGILIIICSIFMIRLLPSEKDNTLSSAYRYKYRSPNRVEYWNTLIQNAMHGKEEAENLRDGLKKLFVSAVSPTERLNGRDLEERGAIGNASMSQATRQYLFSPKGQDRIMSGSRLHGITSLAPGWLRRWAGKFARQDTASIDEILKYMETELEINRDE